MMQIEGKIATSHRNPACVAHAIRVDNLSAMDTRATGTEVTTAVTGTRLRSVIASVDDYLMNLAIADEACRYGKDPAGKGGQDKKDGYRDNENNETEAI